MDENRKVGAINNAQQLGEKSTRYYSLDFWRGTACVMVVIYHSCTVFFTAHQYHWSDGLSGLLLHLARFGYLGVPMFFVISGYCISATAQNTLRKRHRVSTFFLRRFRRIYPPYWILLVVFVPLAALAYFYFPEGAKCTRLSNPFYLQAWQWAGNLTLTETWRYHLAGPAHDLFLKPIWTLAYEEQFYALTGLLILFTPRHFFRGAAIISLVTLFCEQVVSRFGIRFTSLFLDGSWQMFAAGIVVFYKVNYANPRQNRILTMVLWLGVLYCFRHPARVLQEADNLTAFLFALLLCGLYRCDRQLAAARLAAPLMFCGTICYSMYLVHEPITASLTAGLCHFFPGYWFAILVTIPLAVLASALVAWIFYQLVERYFLNTR